MTPDSNAVTQFFQILFWISAGLGSVLGGIWLVIQMVRTGRRTPPIEAEFATKQELEKIENRTRVLEKEVTLIPGQLKEFFNGAMTKLDKADEGRASGIHKRLNRIAENVAGLMSALEVHIETKLNRAPMGEHDE